MVAIPFNCGFSFYNFHDKSRSKLSDNGFVIVQIHCSVIQNEHFMEIVAFNGGHGSERNSL